MKLNQYPQAIAKVEESLLNTTLDLECWQEELYFLNGEIELAIACDADLKNEQMRKAKRLELQQQPDYLQIKNKVKEAKINRDRLQIQVDLLRNQFSVAKLEARLRAASLEAAA